uniref:Uncharacterized protein n=1 Tax=Allium cepa TaxID=4679 RepID=D2XT85_ALLCE|nr:unknown [Allium cepa]ADA85886.1 unknown [Allium cepa]
MHSWIDFFLIPALQFFADSFFR